MVQLVMTFCLMTNSASCIERRPMLEDIRSAMGCMTAAQSLAVEFVRSQPTFRLVSWRCEIGKPMEKSA